jgi:hypothetical protein
LAAAAGAAAATIPGFVIHPNGAVPLIVSGTLGVLLFLGVLAVIRPLSQDDVAAAAAVHPLLGGAAVRVFARR